MGDLVSKWVNRGHQRRAVYRALSFPRTGTQILKQASVTAPRITLQDVRRVLRTLRWMGGVRCLNPNEKTGRIYVGSGIDISKIGVDWEHYSAVARGRARSRVLLEIDQERFDLLPRPKTATGIKRALRNDYPMSLNLAIECLQELKRRGLVTIKAQTQRRECNVYELTDKGREIVEVLRRATKLPELCTEGEEITDLIVQESGGQ